MLETTTVFIGLFNPAQINLSDNVHTLIAYTLQSACLTPPSSVWIVDRQNHISSTVSKETLDNM